jgi:hypothetical protein
MLMKKNFEGKHFWIKGHAGVKLDCMFFPCTLDDEGANVEITNDDNNPLYAPYLEKPTIIMCNPNALIYQ